MRRGGEGFPGLPLGGNRMTPGFQSSELGSGVIIDKAKGYVVTNNHVVKDAEQIMVRLGPGDDVRARLVGADPKSDLAVLQIKADLKVQAEWGDSDKLDIGEWVLAIGSPLGFDHSVTAGIVSATERNDLADLASTSRSFRPTRRSIPATRGGRWSIWPARSWASTRPSSRQSGGYEGIGLAIPSSLARRVVESLIKEGKVVRGYLGVMLYRGQLDTDVAREAQASQATGARWSWTSSPAARPTQVGLKPNDVIVKIADHDVADPAALRNLDRRPRCRRPGPDDFLSRWQGPDGHGHDRRTSPGPGIALVAWASASTSVPSDKEGGGTVVEIDRVVTGSPAFQVRPAPGHAYPGRRRSAGAGQHTRRVRGRRPKT